jgi:glucokinase
LLEHAGGPGEDIDGRHVTAAAQAGDPLGLELLTDLGTWIGAGIPTLTALPDPEIVVIGGGVSRAGLLLLGPIGSALGTAKGGRIRVGGPAVVAAQLADSAGIVGTADLSRIAAPVGTSYRLAHSWPT